MNTSNGFESWGRGYFKIQELCKQVNANLPEPENLSGGISVVCNASKQYLELAAKYGVDGDISADAQRLHRTCTKNALILHKEPLNIYVIIPMQL